MLNLLARNLNIKHLFNTLKNVINYLTKLNMFKLTFVRPKPLRSTFAELSTDGVTRMCNRRSPLLFATSGHGNSVAYNNMIGKTNNYYQF